MTTNQDRARWAENALKIFIALTGVDKTDAVSDLLCNLQHLCQQDPSYGVFEDQFGRAKRNFDGEVFDAEQEPQKFKNLSPSVLRQEAKRISAAAARMRELKMVDIADRYDDMASAHNLAADRKERDGTGPVPTVVVDIDSGAVHFVKSNVPMRVIILDADTEGGDIENIRTVDNTEVYVHDFTLQAGSDNLLPDSVAKVLQEIQ